MKDTVHTKSDFKLEGLGIEISSKCDYRCVGCPSAMLPRGRGNMDVDLFLRIFREIGNKVHTTFLWNYGDPLVHPDISKMLEGIEKYSCKKILSTTGYRLQNIDNLGCLGSLDELIISINGLSEGVYALHQRRGKLTKVKRGLSCLSKVLEKEKTKLSMQFVVHKGNVHEIGEINRFAERFRFDCVIIKSFNVMDNKKETYDKFVPIQTEYARYGGFGKLRVGIRKRDVYPCMKGLVINWDGSVNACCWDYRGSVILGRIPRQGVFDVWDSEKASSIRKQISAGELLPFCRGDCMVKGNIHRWGINNWHENNARRV